MGSDTGKLEAAELGGAGVDAPLPLMMRLRSETLART